MNLAAFPSFPPCRLLLLSASQPHPTHHLFSCITPKKLHGFKRSFLSLPQTQRINHEPKCKMRI